MVETLPLDNLLIDNTAGDSGSCPFEGPEKLLEIWFAPTPCDEGGRDGVERHVGLRTVDRRVWEDMLDVVKCKVLSVVIGQDMDAYLLRFVQPKSLLRSIFCDLALLIALPSMTNLFTGFGAIISQNPPRTINH
jgi:S-adenosylmethionine decarboxylase